MFEKFSRSWTLVKASAAVLRSDKELLLFPVVSAICTALVAATFILPAIGLGLFDGKEPDLRHAVLAFAFYLSQYFVIFFFNTALVGAAMIRLEGGDPTVADGLRIARGKLVPILGYAAIAATVGLALKMLERRAGGLGRIVVAMIGVAWTLATFMVVPILVTRDIGPIDAVKESASLLRRTWGENVVGNAGIGLAFGLVTALVAVAVVLLVVGVATTLGAWPAIAIAVLGALALGFLAVLQAALSGIYSAALYRFAVDGQAPQGFGGGELQAAFAAK
jgi:hypothetical protein